MTVPFIVRRILMRRLVRLAQAIVLLVAIAVLATGMLALSTDTPQAKGKDCFCPLIYAPVICKGGRIFSNQCLADCRNAKNCVPLDPSSL
jgi:hypothetical protein